MSDLIDRQAAINALYNHREGYTNIWQRTVTSECVQRIKELPSVCIEQERETAKWIDCGLCEDGRIYSCPICMKAYVSKSNYMWANYCPECGADMRGEQDGRFNQPTGGD